jgi:hypothetical protein
VSLEVALAALRHDAGVWERVAAVTRQAGREAAELTLGESHLSWASAPTGLLGTYAEIQRKAVMLLAEATEVYGDLSTTLDQVATAYERDDEHAAAQLKGVWDVRE